MNVYDSQRMGDALAAERLCRDRDDRRGRSGAAQHLPHPREGSRKGLFRDRPHPAAQEGARARRQGDDDRRRRLRRAGRRPGDHAPRARRRPRRRPAILPPAAGRGAPGARRREGGRDRLRDRGQVRASAGAGSRRGQKPRRHRLSHHPGRLRQVLHLLRGALYARLGGFAAGGADRRRGRAACGSRRARGDAARPERERLARRRSGRARNGGWDACCSGWPRFPAWRGCATPPAIRATWTTR